MSKIVIQCNEFPIEVVNLGTISKRKYKSVKHKAIYFCILLEISLCFWGGCYGPTIFKNLRNPQSCDSLTIGFVSNWPFGLCDAVTYDPVRNIAIVGSGGGVYLLDLSEPSCPQKISELRTRGLVCDLDYVVESKILYIADFREGLEIWSLNDPNTPQKLASFKCPQSVKGVSVCGSYAYLANADSVRIIDISVPLNPFEIGVCSVYQKAHKLHAIPPYVYVADHDTDLVIIDVSDPTDPTIISHLNFPLNSIGMDVSVEGHYAYVAANSAFMVVDVSDPYKPTWISHCFTNSGVFGLHIQNDYAYIADGYAGMAVVDISNPLNPNMVGSLKLDYVGDIWVSDNYAYIGDYESGFIIADVTTPSEPELIGRYELPQFYFDISISGSNIYLACGKKGLFVIDITNLAHPIRIDHYTAPRFNHAIDIYSNYAYLADSSFGLRIIDVSDSRNLYEVGSCWAGQVVDLQVDSPYVYIVDKTYGLRIIDSSVPEDPIKISDCATCGSPSSIDILDSLIYITDSDSGLAIINVINPLFPDLIGYFRYQWDPRDVQILFPYAYVADFSNKRIVIVDISNPSDPKLVNVYRTKDYPMKIHVVQNYAYIAALLSVKVLDISNPIDPIEVGYYTTARYCVGIYALPPYLFTIGSDGLQVLKIY